MSQVAAPDCMKKATNPWLKLELVTTNGATAGCCSSKSMSSIESRVPTPEKLKRYGVPGLKSNEGSGVSELPVQRVSSALFSPC